MRGAGCRSDTDAVCAGDARGSAASRREASFIALPPPQPTLSSCCAVVSRAVLPGSGTRGRLCPRASAPQAIAASSASPAHQQAQEAASGVKMDQQRQAVLGRRGGEGDGEAAVGGQRLQAAEAHEVEATGGVKMKLEWQAAHGQREVKGQAGGQRLQAVEAEEAPCPGEELVGEQQGQQQGQQQVEGEEEAGKGVAEVQREQLVAWGEAVDLTGEESEEGEEPQMGVPAPTVKFMGVVARGDKWGAQVGAKLGADGSPDVKASARNHHMLACPRQGEAACVRDLAVLWLEAHGFPLRQLNFQRAR